MYVVLVGRPGIGKSKYSINPAIKLLTDAGTANILSDKLTIEYVLDTLSKGFSVTSVTGLAQSMSGYQSGVMPTFGRESASIISAPELSVFLKHPEDALPILNQLWDADPGKMQYGTRYKRLVEIADPCQCLLGGSAPQYLVKSIPNDAVGGGFTRRVSFIYSDVDKKPIYFPDGHGLAGIRLRQDLISDLQHIGKSLGGAFDLADAAAKGAFTDLIDASVSEEFDDEAVASYKTSLWVHATKLAIILSASRGDDKAITVADIKEALNATKEVAKDIPKVFRGVGSGSLTELGEAILKFVEAKGYATRGAIARACWKTSNNPDDIDRLLTLFTSASPPFLEIETLGNKILYKPVMSGGNP
jgi:hypothetical protein